MIDAHQAHAVMRLQHNKTDANDATLLAVLGRKLAVVLHKMWVSGEDFVWPQTPARAKAAP
jgi:hypothetical protein